MNKNRQSVELQDSTKINEMLLLLDSNELKAIDIHDKHPLGEGALQRLKKVFKLRQLLNTLRDNQSVAELSLKACTLKKRESALLASSLENKTEVELNLSHLRDSTSGDRSAIAISRVIKSLKGLNLRENGITDFAISFLAQALRENTTVKKLNLSANKIRSEGMQQLANAIRENKSLIEISLNKNKIRFIAAKELAQALADNTSVTHFHLRDNRIVNEGAIAFANTLRQNSTLQKLDLSNNLIEENGIIALAQALKINTSLIRLDLSSNELSDNALEHLAEAMKQNTTLMDLRLYNKVPEKQNRSWIEIQNSLYRNRTSVPRNQAKELLNNQDNPKDFQKITELLQKALQMSPRVTDQNSLTPQISSLIKETITLLTQTYLLSNNLNGLLEYYKSLKNPPAELSTQLAEAIAAQDTSTSVLNTQEKWELVLYLLQNTDNTRLKCYALHHLKEAFSGNKDPKGFLTENDSFERMAKAIYQDPNSPTELKQVIERVMIQEDLIKTPKLKNMPSFFSKKEKPQLHTHSAQEPDQNSPKK